MTVMVVDLPELPVVGDGSGLLDADDRRAVADQLAARLHAIEVLRRWCEAETVAVLDVADRHGLFGVDGHRNVGSWAGAHVNWSYVEGRDRAREVALVRDVAVVGVELGEGKLGVAQVRELARLRANPRCGDELVDVAGELVEAAKQLPFHEFKLVAQRWEQYADANGAHRGHEAAHDGRRVTTATLDDTFHLSAQFGTVQGAAIAEILERFAQAEFDSEWERLTAIHGEAMNNLLLERTPSQRRADALYAIFQAAISTPPDAQPPDPVVNIIIDDATFEEWIGAAATGHPPPPPTDPGDLSRRCETDTGAAVDPSWAVAAAIVGHVRRVVTNAAGVVIDMSRRTRLYRGSARVAAFLQDGRRCIWPGWCATRRCLNRAVMRGHRHWPVAAGVLKLRAA